MIDASTDGRPYKIDTHHHILPPFYLEQERERILAVGPGFTKNLFGWTPARSIESMDSSGVATAVTSISAPGIWFGNPSDTRTLARRCNEFGAAMTKDYPGRFGLFATLPLPDVDASLNEIAYAFDVLKSDGIGLMTNYGGIQPGAPEFLPVFEELNRRAAVVYFHPMAPECCTRHAGDIPSAIMEYPFDTTRAIASLLFSGTFARCPNIDFIFSHAGGTLPMLAHRVARLATIRPELAAQMPNGAMHEFRRAHYDIVSATNPITFDAILKLAGAAQLLFGSDFPYWDPALTSKELETLDVGEETLKAIYRGNALRLMPQLA